MKKNKTVKCEEILCAGFGGQGIMLAGKLLAEAALLDGKYVTWMPSYGAEVRGGTAHSMIKISANYVGSPVIKNPSICLVMNYPSLVKYENAVRPGGLLVVNKSLSEKPARRKDITVVNIPMTKIAYLLGNVKAANMVGLGALVKKTKVVSKDSLLKALAELLKGKQGLISMNKKAFEKGYNC